MLGTLKAPALVSAVLLAGCGGSAETNLTTGETPSWLVAEQPSGARPVTAVKETAREGDQVVIRGRIGGRADPMSADLAVFVMMDPAIKSCSDLGQSCPKPWDYCCETPESLKTNSVTVQIVDASNETVRVDLSRHGFKPLDEVVVVGTVGPRPNPEVFVIKAEKIHRVSG